MEIAEYFNDESLHPDIAQLSPFYDKLDSNEVESIIDDILKLAEDGNKYAVYLYASLKLFGRKPRYYKFSKAYPAGEVERNAVMTIDEQTGLMQFASMLKIQPGEIGYFHIEALYDLYKIVDGRDEFFKTNDIKLRPKSENDTFHSLFDIKDRLRNLLIKMDYPEIYIDAAEHYLEKYSITFAKLDIDKAIKFLKQIIEDEYQTRFSVTDLSRAYFLLGRLLLRGAIHVQRSEAKGIAYLEASRSDDAMLELIRYYKESDQDYSADIKHCLGLIQDEERKNIAYKECAVERPKPVDINETLDRLISIKPNKKASLNMAFDFDAPAVNVDERLSTKSEEQPRKSDEDVTRQAMEVAQSFELLSDSDDEDDGGVVNLSSGDDAFDEDGDGIEPPDFGDDGEDDPDIFD